MKTLVTVTCAFIAVVGVAQADSIWDATEPPTWADGVDGVDDLGGSYALGTVFTTDTGVVLTQVKCWFSSAEIDEAINDNDGNVFATLWADGSEAFSAEWDISGLDEGWNFLDVAVYNLSAGVDYVIAVDTYGGYAYEPNTGDITSGTLTATEGLFVRAPGDLPSEGFNLYYFRDIVTLPPVSFLQAGDADQDFDFDQLDLVKVQVAAKYLTGQAATWGEGDWNGAPGGMVGLPPPGDGMFNQLDIIAALNAGWYLRGPYAALAPGAGTRNNGQTSIVYDAASGEVSVDAPSGRQLTSVNIDSAAGIFTGAAAQNLGGSFDNDADNNIFKATFGSSFGAISFGNVARPGLSEEFVLGDMTVVGSLAGGGDLGAVDLIYVPEPATALLAMIGLIAVCSLHSATSRYKSRRTAEHH